MIGEIKKQEKNNGNNVIEFCVTKFLTSSNFIPFQDEKDLEYHEHIANMLFMGTILAFVLLTLYAFVYSNYRKRIKMYLALDLKVPGCNYYETDSEESDDEVFITKEEEKDVAEPGQSEPGKRESILARL